MKYSLLLTTNAVMEYMYWDVKGNILKIKKMNSQQESLFLASNIIVIIFFCNLQTSMLCEEFPQNNST